MLEKILPIAGPRMARITITTTATKTRIKAYSTKPWPFSFGANSIVFTSFLFVECNAPGTNYYYKDFGENCNMIVLTNALQGIVMVYFFITEIYLYRNFLDDIAYIV
jgi:hypothetical protein